MKLILIIIGFGQALLALAEEAKPQERAVVYSAAKPKAKPTLVVYDKMPDDVTGAPLLIGGSSNEPENEDAGSEPQVKLQDVTAEPGAKPSEDNSNLDSMD